MYILMVKTLITRGQFNINHHKSHKFPEALPIDEYVDVEFPLDVIGYHLPKGHQLEVSMAPTYWPQVWPSAEVNLTHSNIEVSYVNDFKAVTLNYPHSETAEPLEKEVIREGSRTRNVIKQLTEDKWGLADYLEEGLRNLPHLNITYGTENYNDFVIVEDDPLSAYVKCTWDVVVKDDDIDTRVKTISEMWCDETYLSL